MAAAQPLALAANGTLSINPALLTDVGAVKSGSIVPGLPLLQRFLLLCCLPENGLELVSTACHVAWMLVCRLLLFDAGFGPIDLGSSNLTAGSADLQNTTTGQLTVLGPTQLGTGGENASLQVTAPSTFQGQVQLQGTLHAQRGVVLGSTVSDSMTVAASAFFLSPLRAQGSLTVAGNATIGTEPANLLLINATVLAIAPITAAQLTAAQLTVQGSTVLGTAGSNSTLAVASPATFQGAVQLQEQLIAHRGAALGSSAADSLQVAASATFLSPVVADSLFTAAGSAQLGSNDSSLLQVNATLVVTGPATMGQLTVLGNTVLGAAGGNASLTVAAPAAFQSGAQMQGPVTLGSSKSSRNSTSLAVNAPLVTIGASRSDSLVVNSTSNFSSIVLLQDALAVAGPAGFKALNASGLATFSGEANMFGPEAVNR